MFDALKHLDQSLFLWLNGLHYPVLDPLMYYVSQVFVFAPLFIYWFYQAYLEINPRRLFAFVVMLGLIIVLCDQSSNQVKHAVQRYRPTHNLEIQNQVHTVNEYKGGKYGFFSGHAANTFGIATFLFLAFKNKSRRFRYHFFIWAAIVSYSRIYLGVHYPSDILMGILTGLFWGFVIYKLTTWSFFKLHISREHD